MPAMNGSVLKNSFISSAGAIKKLSLLPTPIGLNGL